METALIQRESQEYYILNVLGRELGIKRPRNCLTNIPSHLKFKFSVPSRGGNQSTICLSKEGAILLVQNCRRKDTEEVVKKYGFNLREVFLPSVEVRLFKQITQVFHEEDIKHQFRVQSDNFVYYIDIYFIEYKIAIEIDEKHVNVDGDIRRQRDIENMLGCTFLRCSPLTKDFDIFQFMGNIYSTICNKRKEIDELCDGIRNM